MTQDRFRGRFEMAKRQHRRGGHAGVFAGPKEPVAAAPPSGRFLRRPFFVSAAVLALVAIAALAGQFGCGKPSGPSTDATGAAPIDMSQPLYEAEVIFDPEAESHGHVHASCVVECPDGSLRAVWYENSPPFPTEQRDRSDDVRIGGSRKPAGADEWEKPFVMSDTPGRSDNNPCMVIDGQGRLWLVHATLGRSPGNTWDSAAVRYKISTDYQKPGLPNWSTQHLLDPRFEGLHEIVLETSAEDAAKDGISAEDLATAREKVRKPSVLREGWMPRAHPFVRSDGTVILPLASEHFLIAAMAMTADGGETWTFSSPVPDIGVEQPTLVEFPDGRMIAYLRNKGVEHRIKQTTSEDGGMTWTPTTITDLRHPQSGVEAILLDSGHLAIVYNDTEDDPRDSLAVSISEDDGKTWRWTRHLERTSGERFDYPSMIQARDGSLHVTYTYNLKTVKHARFNEAWVQQGDSGG